MRDELSICHVARKNLPAVNMPVLLKLTAHSVKEQALDAGYFTD